jgi:hypothetical protein
MELLRPLFNFMPRHAFATKMPEEMRRQAAEAVERALKGIPGPEVADEAPYH